MVVPVILTGSAAVGTYLRPRGIDPQVVPEPKARNTVRVTRRRVRAMRSSVRQSRRDARRDERQI